MDNNQSIHPSFKPLTTIIGYVFGFLITATLICFLMVLYIHEQSANFKTAVPSETQPTIVVKLTDSQKKGKELFQSNCASCHKLKGRAIGPALGGVTTRLDDEWLYPWIKNSTAMITSGDTYAVNIYNDYNQTTMNSFPQLSDEDIAAILTYTDTGK